MAQYRNVAGVDLDIPGVGVVEDDGVFQTDNAAGFACQPANYAPADEAAQEAVDAYEESQQPPEPTQPDEPVTADEGDTE